MELLAQCSRVLYNEDLLHAKGKLYLHTLPRIKYKDREEWVKVRDLFNANIAKKIKEFENDGVKTITSFKGFDIYNDKICRYYKQQLYILTKGQAKEWCKHKVGVELYSMIEAGFAGLSNIAREGGWGTFPFTNWRKLDYLLFIKGIIFSFQNNFRSQPPNIDRSWIDQIPYFECRCCRKRVDMYDNTYRRKATREYIMFLQAVGGFWLGSSYLCKTCVTKKKNDIIKLQALSRGWLVRKKNKI